jgi:glycosyltransferase involved in cell wall biosynthesis
MLSVLEQHYPELEYIVQDGGSSDGTASILQRYGTRLSHCECRSDAGQADGINRGFLHATGEIMAYLNADDLLLPGALRYVAAFFAGRPEVDVVYSHRVLIDEIEQEVGRWVLPPHDDEILSWSDYVPQETVFWRRRIWERVGGSMDESFRFALDWDLLLRFRAAGATFVRLPRFLAAFRVHPQQKTSAQMAEVGAREMDRLRERCHGRPVSPAEVALRTRRYLRRHLLCDLLYRLGVLRY